ncbi:MAG TPA: glycosyltransferase family 2 protein [Planctomycetota bacterium]|nr:glycosyltransferase family 2 protein [Planctomycetota bacterium]
MSDTARDLPKISACIISLNEADRIGDCLRSVSWCDEVVVVDCHSKDRTREIAAEMGARVIERDWPGHVAQKEFAIRQASHDWVFCIDCDERVSEELQVEIAELRKRGFPDKAGWRFPRCTQYLGRWIRHGNWYPDRQLRLFDRRRGKWGGNNPHDRVQLDSRPGELRGDLWHLPYRSISEHLRTIDNYTTIMAEGLHARGRKAGVSDLWIRPAARFVNSYVLRLGFLEGWRGFLIACLAAQYVRLKWAKLLILQDRNR